MYKKDYAISIENLGKMYKLYKNPKDKLLDAFGLGFLKKDYYKEFWALRGVDIKIKKGERVGIIGHNGAGKSTFLKMVIGNIEPSEGKMQINGKIQALMELGTGFHPDFTGRENIRASLAYNSLSNGEIKKRQEEIIDFAELGDYIDQPVKTYSAGMYARLAFSTATAIEPEILIIDEVLGAGDAYFSGKCIERMKNITNQENTTVLFVSHDLASVQALCERIIWIDKGRVRYDGDALTAIKRYSDVVREHQENRLRIRDQKVQKKQDIILDKEEELYTSVMCRLYSEKKVRAKVRRISIRMGEEVLGSIAVGMPMDNDNKDRNHIVDEKGIMCWSDTQQDPIGFFRIFDNQIGSYGHAPFYLSWSKAIELTEPLQVSVDGEILKGNSVKVQRYNEQSGSYETIGILQGDGDQEDECFCVGLSADEPAQEVSAAEVEFQDSEKCRFTEAKIYDQNGQERKVFPFENQISKFCFQAKFAKKKDYFYFAFLIFTLRGEIIISQCQRVQMSQEDEVKIEIELERFRLGAGIYTISMGIYDELDVMDNSKAQSAIALIDRGLSFEIESPLNYQLNIGSVLPELKINLQSAEGRKLQCNSMI
ncbi:ABC transporter ATP-binding protein [Anaerovorax sp. IOR16]|uniref:ABC transporter ATP-binding protein n=1 Tax=Anaerovorax sp. IOR16 TaxID=2773458 RepID=UPI0019D14AF0|nr:ABC transporter ATP-binding protein [Anaerovorax sp. IOR16]